MPSGVEHPVDAMVCDHCGSTFNKPTAKFCSKCGTKKKAVSTGQRVSHPEGGDMITSSGNSKGGSRATATFKLGDDSNTSSSNKSSKNTTAAGNNSTSSSNSNNNNNKQMSLHSAPSRLPPMSGSDATSRQDGCILNSIDDESVDTLRATPEEEAKYNAWTTLGPEGITPEMLQTSNANELSTWRRGLLIGRGTYGSVYLGLLNDGSFYAVKCVEVGGNKGVFSVKELVSLSREINMMHRLQHKNLCTFKGVHYDAPNNTICMFMEYIGGGSLSSLVKKFKPLPPDVVRRWTRQLLSGLLYLHSQRIIHRDIKGDNILVEMSSDARLESQIKLVDFGAARRLSDAVAQSRTVIGTPYWMAPEVVDVTGDGSGYSYKADVWSVGCTVAEMLTGKPPWPSKVNAPAAIMMIAQAKDGPTEIPEAEATPGCLDFMRKCLVRDPEMRPTVEELLQHPWILGEGE